MTYSWTGTPHNSESVEYVNGVETRRNRVLNPQLKTTADNWSSLWGLNGVGTRERVGDYLPWVDPDKITFFLRQRYTTAPTEGGVSANVARVNPTVSEGDEISVSCYGRSPVAANLSLYVQFYNGASWVSNLQVYGESVPAWTWRKFQSVITVPAGVDVMYVGIRRITLPTVGAAFDVATPMVGSDGEYFDGDTPSRTSWYPDGRRGD